VDDEPDVVRCLSALLSDHGFTVSAAQDGGEALTKARAEQPDLITLDITMPGKSGVDVFTTLRRDPQRAGIPVFIITGVVDFRRLMYYREVQPPKGTWRSPSIRTSCS
jgi:CheY-like chemotaxis protein